MHGGARWSKVRKAGDVLRPIGHLGQTLDEWLSRMFTNLRRQSHRAQHGGALNKDLTEEEEEEEGDFQIRIPEDRRPSIPPRSQLRRLTSTGRMLTDIGEASTTTSSAVPPPAP